MCLNEVCRVHTEVVTGVVFAGFCIRNYFVRNEIMRTEAVLDPVS